MIYDKELQQAGLKASINQWSHRILIIIKMQQLGLILLFLYLANSQLTIIAQSDTTTTISSPTIASGVTTQWLNSNHPNIIPGVSWIWNNAGDYSPANTVLSFTKLFYTSCTGPLTLTIAAFGNWAVWWDSVNLKNGSNWQNATSFTINPTCNSHNLTIAVNKTSVLNVSGLIFTLVQNQSNCYNCNSNGFWNQNTCTCQCLTTCECTNTNQAWTPYPTCACTCPIKKIIPLPKITSALIAVRPLPASSASRIGGCPSNQYISPVSCTCRCYYQYCQKGYYYKDDPSTGCGCLPITK